MLGGEGLAGEGLQSNPSLYWSDIPGKERGKKTQSNLLVNMPMTEVLGNKLSPCVLTLAGF